MQTEDWSAWADAQADLNLRWVYSHFVGFVMRRLICSVFIVMQSSVHPTVSLIKKVPYLSFFHLFPFCLWTVCRMKIVDQTFRETENSASECASVLLNELRHDKTNKMSVHPAKTQISLGIRPVWSASSLCTQWIAKDLSFLNADREDWSDWADV